MKKKILIGVLSFGITVIIGFFVLMANFQVFDAPKETELKMECDDSGLRKISMFELSGNATASNSITIKSSDCNVRPYSDDLINAELIFSVSSPNIQRSDLNFKWKDFDTLTIIYNKGLRILKQEFESKTVKQKIIFQYITDSTESEMNKLKQVGKNTIEDWRLSEHFEFENFREYKISDTIHIDLNGNGILERVYFENTDCLKLLIKENGQKTISIGCGKEEYEGFPNIIDWVVLWCVVSDKETFEVVITDGDIIGEKLVSLERPSLFLGTEESGGGIITYKNGELYWVHQSD